MAENGNGWKLSAVLGGLLCALFGALVGVLVLYNGHLSWAATKSSEVDSKLAVLSTDQKNFRDDLIGVKTELGLLRQQIAKQTRIIERTADATCVRDTGRVCPRAAFDEAP